MDAGANGPKRPVRVRDLGTDAADAAVAAQVAIRATEDVTLPSGVILTVREPSAAETLLVYRLCGDENPAMLNLYTVAMCISAIDGKSTVRSSKAELAYILESFGTMTQLSVAGRMVNEALNRLTGLPDKPKSGETPEQFLARQEEQLRLNLRTAPATP